MRTIFHITSAALIALGLTACDPYNPTDRAVGGGLLGAGAGAAIGGASGGHAGTGALIGGGVGALGGAATTPQRPSYGYGGGYSSY